MQGNQSGQHNHSNVMRASHLFDGALQVQYLASQSELVALRARNDARLAVAKSQQGPKVYRPKENDERQDVDRGHCASPGSAGLGAQ